ncbi:MAG: hypothetical protein IPM51_12620 [Sphingobacteriaceae bacterium]|nr:hypothetical protein [Sphingobacteriaceae bacterium]
MNRLILLIVLSSNVLLAQKAKKIKAEDLINCWSRSFEDENQNAKVAAFRNCDYQFPPRIYRPTVKLEANGKCQILHIGESDIRSFKEGTWTFSKRKKRVTVINGNKVIEMKFRIKKMEKDFIISDWEL